MVMVMGRGGACRKGTGKSEVFPDVIRIIRDPEPILFSLHTLGELSGCTYGAFVSLGDWLIVVIVIGLDASCLGVLVDAVSGVETAYSEISKLGEPKRASTSVRVVVPF